MRRIFLGIMMLPLLTWGQTLEECQEAALRNYPLIHQYDLVSRTTNLTVENIGKGWLPQVSASAQATVQSDVTVLKIEVDVRLTTGEYAQTVVIDDERWTLLHNQTKNSGIAVHDAHFVVDEERLAYGIGLSGQDILHPLGVH